MSSQHTLDRDATYVLAELGCSPQPARVAQATGRDDLRFLRGGGGVACHAQRLRLPAGRCKRQRQSSSNRLERAEGLLQNGVLAVPEVSGPRDSS